MSQIVRVKIEHEYHFKICDLDFACLLNIITPALEILCFISVPRRMLVCIWEEFSRKGPPAAPYPPAPQVCPPIASLLVDGISSNLAHIFSSPGKIF